MGIYHGNDLRKITGGRKGRHVKVKRKYLMGRFPALTTIGDKYIVKKVRARGGNLKLKLKKTNRANVYIPSTGETKNVRIIKVIDNPSNRDYAMRGVITKGAIIHTELGKAKVTSRPGQDGVINAILLEEQV